MGELDTYALDFGKNIRKFETGDWFSFGHFWLWEAAWDKAAMGIGGDKDLWILWAK